MRTVREDDTFEGKLQVILLVLTTEYIIYQLITLHQISFLEYYVAGVLMVIAFFPQYTEI